MSRMQVELSEEQARALSQTAEREGISIAELVRREVDPVLQRRADRVEERYRRAASIVGRFRSGRRDIGSEHDRELADAYGK